MDKNLLQQIRVDMNAALTAVAKKHGLKQLTAGNCSFDPAGCFTFKVDGVTGSGLSKTGALYENMRSTYGLPPLGTIWNDLNGSNEITGMTTGGKVIFRRGIKEYVADVDSIKKRLNK